MLKRSRDAISSSPNGNSSETDTRTTSAKYAELDLDSSPVKQRNVVRCCLAPHRHPVSFSSYEEYDIHYHKYHINRCSECQRNMPTEHFLNLHLAENHDPINEARRARGDKTYACFVDDCNKVCSTPRKRRMHLIDKHQFPRNYDFFIVNDGIDRRKTMLRSEPQRRRKEHSSLESKALEQGPKGGQISEEISADNKLNPPGEGSDSEDTTLVAKSQKPYTSSSSKRVFTSQSENSYHDDNDDDNDVDIITESMSSLKFVPPSIRFGRARAGFAKQ